MNDSPISVDSVVMPTILAMINTAISASIRAEMDRVSASNQTQSDSIKKLGDEMKVLGEDMKGLGEKMDTANSSIKTLQKDVLEIRADAARQSQVYDDQLAKMRSMTTAASLRVGNGGPFDYEVPAPTGGAFNEAMDLYQPRSAFHQ